MTVQEREKVEKQRVQAELMKMRLDGSGTVPTAPPVPADIAAAAAAAAAAGSSQ